MTLEQQTRLFQSASAVIWPHGGGLCDVLLTMELKRVTNVQWY